MFYILYLGSPSDHAAVFVDKNLIKCSSNAVDKLPKKDKRVKRNDTEEESVASSYNSSSEEDIEYDYKCLSSVQRAAFSVDIVSHAGDAQDSLPGRVADIVFETTSKEYCYAYFDHYKYNDREVLTTVMVLNIF